MSGLGRARKEIGRLVESDRGRSGVVAAKYVLAALALVFLIAGVVRVARDSGSLHTQSKTWLLIAAIFGAVSAWLWYA